MGKDEPLSSTCSHEASPVAAGFTLEMLPCPPVSSTCLWGTAGQDFHRPRGRRCEGLVRGIAKPNDNVRCLAGTRYCRSARTFETPRPVPGPISAHVPLAVSGDHAQDL